MREKNMHFPKSSVLKSFYFMKRQGINRVGVYSYLHLTRETASNTNDIFKRNMAHLIHNQAENILSELKNCPEYLKGMEYTMLSLEAILLDAEEKQQDDQDLDGWLKKLRDLFYQIEDSIDELNWEVSKQEGTGKKVSAPCLGSYPIVARKPLLTCKMKKLCDDLDTIAAKMYEFHLTEKHTAHTRRKITQSFPSATEVSTKLIRPSWQLLYPHIDSPELIAEKGYEIVKEFNDHPHNTLCIVGDAGMGKSTLAKFIYNHKDVVPKFHRRLWVCVKEDFDTHRLIKEIYSLAIGKETYDDMIGKKSLLNVEEYLKGKPFLLVLQDLSIKNLDDLSMFLGLFSNIEYDSKILVTTLSEETAYKIQKEFYQPKFIKPGLSDANLRSLFKEYAFRDKQEPRDPELAKIEEEIVKKCNGVPLAIKCLGKLLSSKTRIAEWKNVRDKLEKEDGSVLATLKLCYNLMPSHLKPCFLICSQLPNDDIVSSNEVIQLWMAHGLLYSPQETNLSLESIGEKYFKELWSECFVQDLEEHGLGYWFKMHPLIKKLACTLAEKQPVRSGVTKPVPEIRSIDFRARNLVPPSASLVNKCISKFTKLRVLYLVNTNAEEIPNAIGKLKYMRYLDLQGNKKMKRLPNSICKLQSLQTLILASCSALEKLPKDIRNLISLRYLWVTADRLYLHKNGVGAMTSLQFLAIGGCDNLHNLFKQPECLACLKTLMIYDCKTLKSLPNKMRFLKALKNLVIWSCKNLTLTLNEVEFQLQRLTIRDLPKVNEIPQWLVASTNSLRILEIINCPVDIGKNGLVDYEELEYYGFVDYGVREEYALDYEAREENGLDYEAREENGFGDSEWEAFEKWRFYGHVGIESGAKFQNYCFLNKNLKKMSGFKIF